MLLDILRHTPLWVYGLLAFLLGLGWIQTRPRSVRPLQVLLLPAVMIVLSLVASVALPAFGFLAAVAWLAGAYFFAGMGLGSGKPQGVTYRADENRFAAPGSWVPMMLILAIFIVRYVANAAIAIRLPASSSEGFAAFFAFLFGSFSGVFAARAAVTWSSKTNRLPRLPTLRWSRAAMFFSAMIALLALDGLQSVNTHFAYPQPTEIWVPTPDQFTEIIWPPGTGTPAGAQPAKRLYDRYCALCHGDEGRGNGAAAPSMTQRPRDFTRGEYKYKSTAAGSPPTDADLRQVIAQGLHASAMPAFGDLLRADEIDQMVAYLKSMSPVFKAEPRALPIPARPAVTSAGVARGERLYRSEGCAGCHGADLRGGKATTTQPATPGLARDLTAPWTFRGGAQAEDVYRRISIGLATTAMPAYERLAAAERWDLVAYLESQRRAAPWEPGGKLAGPAEPKDPLDRGRYLVRSGMCGLCHTNVSPRDVYREDQYLAGGMLIEAYPQGVFVSPNLSSDAETGLGTWSEGEIASAVRNGRAKGGRLLNFWGMPWMYLHEYSEEDALAIARYLKTLPAVKHEVPRPLHYGVLETIVGKAANGDIFPGNAPKLTYAVGSYANLPGWRPDQVQALLGAAQTLVLCVLFLAWPLARRGVQARPATGLQRAGKVVVGVLGVIATVAGAFIHHSPTLGIIPPERVAAGASRTIPAVASSNASAEERALLNRGRKLFGAASCAYCHGNDGSGGYKISAGAGSIFVPNITPHPEAGIGSWTDAQIARALRAGLTREGRPLWWQGMPWDHFSNYEEEDIVAITRYLRTMPPVNEVVPKYQAPSAADCQVYTYWTVKNSTPGCK